MQNHEIRVKLFLGFLLTIFLASGLTIKKVNATSDQFNSIASATRLPASQVGRVPELAKVSSYMGRLAGDEKLLMVISFGVRDEDGLHQLIAEMYDPNSPRFHQWLTPEAFGERFGRSQAEFEQAAAWLQAQGFTIEQAWPNRLSITFSGSASTVESAFQVEMGRYYHAQENRTFYSNQREPTLPQGMQAMTVSLIGLNDADHAQRALKHKADTKGHTATGGARAAFPVRPAGQLPGTRNFIAPKDFGLVYNLKPLADAGFRGQGQRVAILGDSDVFDSDMALYRSSFNLPSVNIRRVIPTGLISPGIKSTDSSAYGEAILDIDSVSAVAPEAAIDLVLLPVLSPVNIRSGELHVINTLRSSVANESFGGCESIFFDQSERTLFLQAVAQGTAFFNSSGDEGAECPSDFGRAQVSCPSCYEGVTSVGGTQIEAQFAANGDLVSVTQENAWNDPPGVRIACDNQTSLGGGAGGGGISQNVSRPAYQSGAGGFGGGVPAGGTRIIPDIAALAGFPNTAIFIAGQVGAGGGTSQSAPLWAGMMAIINQFKGSAQGSPNSELYRLGVNQYRNGGAAVYRDITVGNNSTGPRQPCAPGGVTGFAAGFGYDAVTGWGVPDLNALARNFGGGGGGDGLIEIATDDGTLEGGFHVDGMMTVNRLTPPSYPATLKKIRIHFDQFNGLASPVGQPIRLVAFVGSAGTTAPPTRPTLLVDQSAGISQLGASSDFDVPPVTITSGDFYVGFQAPTPAGGVVFSFDTNGTQQQRGFFSTDGGQTFAGPIVVSGTLQPVNIMIRGLFQIGSDGGGGGGGGGTHPPAVTSLGAHLDGDILTLKGTATDVDGDIAQAQVKLLDSAGQVVGLTSPFPVSLATTPSVNFDLTINGLQNFPTALRASLTLTDRASLTSPAVSADFSQADAGGPTVLNLSYNGAKMKIKGRTLFGSVDVEINGVIVASGFNGLSNKLVVRGNPAVLNLHAGPNRLRILTSGLSSNIFILQL